MGVGLRKKAKCGGNSLYFFLHPYTQLNVRAGRRQQGLIAMKGREGILLDQNLSPLTYHWSSAGMLVTKIISAKELLGKLQTSKNKDFATREQIFS